MGVAQGLMPMPMRMWLRHYALVRMLVVLVMQMAVLVFQRVVFVFMNMAFRQMQPEAHAHEKTCEH